MLKYFLSSILLYVSASLAFGQDEEVVSLQFVSFPISNKSEPIELFLGDEKTIKVELPTSSLSPVYKVPAMSQWLLGEMKVNEEGEKVFKPFGKAKSAGGTKQLILVIREGATYKDGLKMIPLKYDVGNFSGGKYFIMNATKVDIGVQLGATQVALKPNTYKLAKPKESNEVNGHKELFVKVFFRNKDGMKPFYNSKWRLNDKARNLVFFYHEPHHRRIRTHTIRDYLRQE